uniref:Putative secreted peptide n=1 Tax=Rhipicephalus pulchellus TaxID=72859 RepID=L7M9W1_RHIPC
MRNLNVGLLTVAVLFALHTVCSGMDDYIDWGGTSGNECDHSQQCSVGNECCVSSSDGNRCKPLAQIGQRCSEELAGGGLYKHDCPCVKPHTCGDKGEGIKICEAPKG